VAAAARSARTTDRTSAHDQLVGDRIVRFDDGERILHWVVAVLVLVLAITGSILYFDFLSTRVGRRELLRTIHLWTGLALPLPVLAVVAGKWRHGLRRDVARVSRWTRDDSRFIRTLGRDPMIRAGKFNAGQKLNTLFIAATLPVSLATGAMLGWPDPFPDSWRNGATTVHDWAAFGIWLVVTGHIVKALSEPVALRGMISGRVPATWAKVHRPRWYERVVEDQSGDGNGGQRPLR
jgi:formate dehydrogenase subunit gamma